MMIISLPLIPLPFLFWLRCYSAVIDSPHTPCTPVLIFLFSTLLTAFSKTSPPDFLHACALQHHMQYTPARDVLYLSICCTDGLKMVSHVGCATISQILLSRGCCSLSFLYFLLHCLLFFGVFDFVESFLLNMRMIVIYISFLSALFSLMQFSSHDRLVRTVAFRLYEMTSMVREFKPIGYLLILGAH